MTSNSIHDLLTEVTHTAEMPSEHAIRESVSKYRSTDERTEIARQVTVAARSIINALDAGLPDQATAHAADVAENLAEFTRAGAAPVELPERGWGGRTDDHRPRPRSASAPLQELLRGATEGEIRARDLDALALRSGMSAEDRTKWRADVLAEARKIKRTFATGAQGGARAMADEAADRLGADLVEPEPVDPADGIDDPAELAAMVRRH
jgi:hypothetical protein